MLRYWRKLHARVGETLRSARLHPIGSICWVLSTACLGISLSFVVSTGPDIQNYLYALIRSDSPSIYGSAYQDGLVRFPSLRQWLASAFQLQFLTVAVAIVGFSFPRNGARSVFVSGVLASYLSLVTCDLAVGIWERNLSGPYLLENLIANAAGALVVAFVLVAVMIAGHACFISLRGPNFLRGLAASFVTLVVGVCISSAVYHMAKFFYRPIPVRLDMVLDAPVNGTIGTKGEIQDTRGKRPRAQVDDDRGPFQIFPSQLENGTLRWNSPKEDNAFAVRWSKLSNSGGFEATIEFYADCFGDAINTAPAVEGHQLKIVDLSEFAISLDPGPAEFGTLDRSKSSGRMTTKSGSFAMYSIDADPSSKRSKTTQFADKDAELTVRSEGRSLGFYLNAVLLAAAGSGITPSTRTFTVKTAGKTYSIQAAKPRGATKTIGELACRSIDPDLHRAPDPQQSGVCRREGSQGDPACHQGNLPGRECRHGPGPARGVRGGIPAIGLAWRRAWEHVVPFFAFAPGVRKMIYTTDEIDKHFLARRGIFKWRGRPRGEAWRIGRKRRQAALQFMPCRIEAPARPLAGAGAKLRQNARSSSAPVPRRASPGSGVP